MIRAFKNKDLSRVAEIWLQTNLEAHDFIPEKYWRDNYNMVKEMLAQAEIYVAADESQSQINGFIGLSDNYIAGLFVSHQAQSHGIGKQLLDYAKSVKPQLTLSVYQENSGAVNFYQRENFQIDKEQIDQDTGQKEFLMSWRR